MAKAAIGAATLLLLSAIVGARAGETDAGTPREDTLIIDGLYPSIPKPNQLNPFLEGVDIVQGLKQLGLGALWEINTRKGEQFPALAATPLTPLDPPNYTKFQFKIRQGVEWSDGAPFTADDVVDTLNMLRNHFAAGSILKDMDVRKVDDVTVQIDAKTRSPHLQELLGVMIAGTNFWIVPDHIWHDKDPTHFANSNPVVTGPYTLKRADPHGNWVLWERRANWARSDVGMMHIGRPEPRYVLYRSYGSEQERVAAMLRNDLDIAMPLSKMAYDELKAKSPYVKGWSDGFPGGTMDDPCDKGIHFNDQDYPYNQWQVRWALALAIDIDRASMDTLLGALRVAPLAASPIAVLSGLYYDPLRQWLGNFALADGYKPFDSGFATRMANMLQQRGVKGIPSDPDSQRTLFGIGWWRHDPEEAARLLESVGFKKVGVRWQVPNEGRTAWTPWIIHMNIPDGFEVLQENLGRTVTAQWQEFGIDVRPQPLDHSRFFEAFDKGKFEAGPYWTGSCSIARDLFDELAYWTKSNIRPDGEVSNYDRDRFSSQTTDADISNIVNHLPEDPQQVEYGKQLLKDFVAQMPAIQMFGTTQFVPVNTYYWTNEPSADNPYEGPWWWWSTFKFMLPNFKQTGRH